MEVCGTMNVSVYEYASVNMFLSVCMCVFMRECVCIYRYASMISIYEYVCECVGMGCACMGLRQYAFVSVCACMCIRVSVCLYCETCICVYVSPWVYMCMFRTCYSFFTSSQCHIKTNLSYQKIPYYF